MHIPSPDNFSPDAGLPHNVLLLRLFPKYYCIRPYHPLSSLTYEKNGQWSGIKDCIFPPAKSDSMIPSK